MPSGWKLAASVPAIGRFSKKTMKALLIASLALLLACSACGGYSSPMGTAPAATPAITPAPGSYAGPQMITISDTTPNAAIYYTTDGTTPTTASKRYSGPVVITQTTMVQAVAIASGYTMSQVVTATYMIAM